MSIKRGYGGKERGGKAVMQGDTGAKVENEKHGDKETGTMQHQTRRGDMNGEVKA